MLAGAMFQCRIRGNVAAAGAVPHAVLQGAPMPAVPVTLSVDERTLAVLDRHIDLHRPGHSRAEVITEILAVWAASPEHAVEPDEGLRPEDLNASNEC